MSCLPWLIQSATRVILDLRIEAAAGRRPDTDHHPGRYSHPDTGYHSNTCDIIRVDPVYATSIWLSSRGISLPVQRAGQTWPLS